MYLSLIQLAQHRGRVTIKRKHDGARFTDVYSVLQHDLGGALVNDVEIDYIDGEDLRDTKSRAIAAVRQLGYWPELKREIARDRGFIDGGAAVRRNPQGAIEQLLDSGLILPPGVA